MTNMLIPCSLKLNKDQAISHQTISRDTVQCVFLQCVDSVGRLADPTSTTTCGLQTGDSTCISTQSWWGCKYDKHTHTQATHKHKENTEH